MEEEFSLFMTPSQQKYRLYLLSDHWKEKRKEALTYYGNICSRCGEYGNEVHHLSYARLNREKLEDLTILCRECHKSVHNIKEPEKPKPIPKNKREVNRQAIFRLLKSKQKKDIAAKFSITENQLYLLLIEDVTEKALEIARFCAKLLGYGGFYGKKEKQKDPPKKKKGPTVGKKRRKKR